MADKKNYYDILGVQKNASDADIKAAYRKKVKEYHPDLHPGDATAAEKFKEINEANETLSDKQKRAAYDYELEHPGMGGMGGGFSGQGFSGFGGFEDIFSSFFGGGMGGSSGRPEDNVGEDIKREMSLSFMDAAKGCTREFSYTRNKACPACKGTGAKNGTAYSPCAKCSGQGRIRVTQNTMFGRTVRVTACPDCSGTGKKIIEKCHVCKGKRYNREEEKLNITIPAGADNQSYILKRGMGHASLTGGPAGDLYIVFRVEPHKIFQRKGMDLFIDLPIPYATAALGGKVRVPDLNDSFLLDIPEGTQNGTTIIMRGKGIASRQGTGSLHIRTYVEVPTKLSKEQKKELEKILHATDVKQYPRAKQYADDMEALYGKKPY
ncbi:MAG: molecular chaperone DnaJ [Clostridia bacterium]|nr:molecular chaperone DnaJ [Clostridia bacterium]